MRSAEGLFNNDGPAVVCETIFELDQSLLERLGARARKTNSDDFEGFRTLPRGSGGKAVDRKTEQFAEFEYGRTDSRSV